MNEQEISAESSTVLVVDDDDMLNFLFCSFLESKGLTAISATSIAEAKEALRAESHIDLILLDYQLGDGVGMDLLQSNSLPPDAALPPVIMISANEEPEFLAACFQAGVNDYIIKPVNLSLLALKVEALIKSVKMQQIIALQKEALEQFKQDAEREEQIAKFTYEYLVKQNSFEYEGIQTWLQSSVAFSGDMVLARKSPGGILYFVMVDATGHGLSAAITIMPLVTIFNTKVSQGFHLQQIATELNRKLVTDTPDDKFVAAILIEINPYTKELSVWNGGMPSVYLVDNNQIIDEFRSEHMSLGILDDDMFDATIKTINLPESGVLYACSDGIIEQVNEKGEEFGIESIKGVLCNERPDAIIPALREKLLQHSNSVHFTDDVTLGVIHLEKLFVDSDLKLTSAKQFELESHARLFPFEWQVQLSGEQLRTCSVPPLANQFLQIIGVDQQCCQKVFAVVAEMVSNAIDHGVLGLSSQLKNGVDGFVAYFSAREEAMQRLTDQDYIRIKMSCCHVGEQRHLIVEVEDSGTGYLKVSPDTTSNESFSGRGMSLIHRLSESVEIFPPGNKIRATIK